MKKMLTVTLALVALAAFSDPAVAQQKGKQKSPAAGGETKQPAPTKQPGPQEAATINTSKSNTYRVAADKASPQLITGKVTKLDEKANTFTVMAKGEEVTFSAAKLKAPLPKVGAIIDIIYTQTTPGGPLESINLNSSKSNSY